MFNIISNLFFMFFTHLFFFFFFFNDTATTEIYTLSLHDALPIYWRRWAGPAPRPIHAGWHGPPAGWYRPAVRRWLRTAGRQPPGPGSGREHAVERTKPWFCLQMENGHAAPLGARCSPDRKSTRLNSSHLVISYAVFCL